MEQMLQRRMIEAVAATVIAHADELTHLDRQIGDGDHGINMRRGFEAVLAEIDNLTAKPFPEAVKAIGTMLVMKVGGASGPLYGTLFLALAKEVPADCEPTATARAFLGAIEAVKTRGKSQAGQKTMLDVLVPVGDEFAAGGEGLAARVKARAFGAAEATVPM